MITYNHEPYITQAIEGVLMQKTDFPFELVIGEDCSTDGTRERVLAYQKKYPGIIRVITSKQNVGMKKNGRRTEQACNGKYIAFCEGDDYWHNPNKLQLQVNYLETHPKCGLVCSDYDVYNTTTNKHIKNYVKYRQLIFPDKPQLIDFLIRDTVLVVGILTCAVIARKKLVEDIRKADPYLHCDDIFLMGDTQLWAEMSVCSEIHFIGESFVTHNILANSASNHKDLKKQLRFYISGAKLYCYLCAKYEMPTNLKKMHKGNLQHYSLQLAFHEMNPKLAEKVRKDKIRFTYIEWLKYYGAKNTIIHFLCGTVMIVKNIFRKKYLKWS